MIASTLPRTVLDEARHQVETYCREFAKPDVDAVREAVEAVHRLTGTLGELVDRIREHAPSAFDGGNQHVGEELARDLHATRGCLTTAGLLVAPALDDLRELTDTTPGVGTR
ncbi:hypothetical protein [Haloechinothrix salitolerans]